MTINYLSAWKHTYQKQVPCEISEFFYCYQTINKTKWSIDCLPNISQTLWCLWRRWRLRKMIVKMLVRMNLAKVLLLHGRQLTEADWQAGRQLFPSYHCISQPGCVSCLWAWKTTCSRCDPVVEALFMQAFKIQSCFLANGNLLVVNHSGLLKSI